MITVAILINGHPIMARSATRTGKQDRRGRDCYHLDDGTQVMHNRDSGAVPLAISLLKSIKEQKSLDD